MERKEQSQPEIQDKSKRAFLKTLGKGLLATAVFPKFFFDGLADCPTDPNHCIPPLPPTAEPTETAQPTETPAPRPQPQSRSAPRGPESSSSDDYLNSIEPLRAQFEPSVLNDELFLDKLFRNFAILQSPERIGDFEMYFPMYMAGEKAYQIPWLALWLIHIQETTVSRSPRPENNGFRGGMQIHISNYPNLKGATKGWEFLDALPQRYSHRNGSATNDWEEILRATLYIRRLANLLRVDDDEAAVLNVVRNSYSAPVYGQQRVDAYRKLKPYLSL